MRDVFLLTCSLRDLRPRPTGGFSAEERSHSRASPFPTTAWLLARRSTYGHQPVAFTTPPTAALASVVVFGYVESRLTGRWLVSLSLPDRCGVLSEAEVNVEAVLVAARRELHRRLRKRTASSSCLQGPSGHSSHSHAFAKGHIAVDCSDCNSVARENASLVKDRDRGAKSKPGFGCSTWVAPTGKTSA
jgi:hypothetical protein